MGGSGSLGGTAMGGPVNMAGILSGIRGLGMPRSFQGPDFTAMQGAVPSQQPATAMLPQPQIQQIGTPAVSQQPMSTGIAPGPQGRGRPGQVNPTVPKMHGGRSPQGAPTIAAKEAQENPRTSEETQPGLAPNPSKPKLHGGHSPRGRPSEEKKAGQFSTMPSWQQWNKGLEEDINATAMMVRRVNSTVEDLSVKDWDRISRDLTGQGFGNTTIEKVIQVVKNTNLVKRYNYVAKGNTMSFKNHPYLYRDNDGNVSVEYPCARDWRKNVVGQVGKLKINFQSPGEHGETEIGTVSYGWDEENDCPDDILEYDRDAVMQELERHNQHESEVYKRLKEAKDPDQSTEYMCRTTVHNNRKWQIDFKPDPDTGRFDTCLVNFGNCPSGQCDFTGDITAR